MININIKNEGNLVKNFCNYFYSNSQEEIDIKNIYIQYYSLSKKNGKSWSDDFIKQTLTIFKDKNLPLNIIQDIKRTLEFKLLINENILFNIKNIINGKIINLEDNNGNKNNINLNLKISNYINICNSFLTSKIYKLFNAYYLHKKTKINFTGFEVLFDDINDCSIFEKIISKSEDKYTFKISTSKYSDFYLYFDNKLITIYDSISEFEDCQNSLLNFIHTNFIYSENKLEIENKLRTLENNSKEKFINNISRDDEIDYYLIKEILNKNAYFIFNFKYNKLDYYFNQNEIFCLYLKNISMYNILNKKINSNISNLFIKDISFNNEINTIDNDYIEETIMKAINTIKDYDQLITNINFSLNNNYIIKNIIVKILLSINEDIKTKNFNEDSIKNSMYKNGLFNEKNRDYFYEIISDINTIKIKDFDKIFNKDFKWISNLIININNIKIKSEILDMVNSKTIDEIIIKTIQNKNNMYSSREIKNIINKIKKV